MPKSDSELTGARPDKSSLPTGRGSQLHASQKPAVVQTRPISFDSGSKPSAPKK